METSTKEIESVTFPPDLKNLRIAESLIADVGRDHHINEEHNGNILIAVREAVTKPIQHGSMEDASKTVTIAIHRNDKELKFTIADNGDGFAFDNLPDPTAPENIEKESGRGIFLMKSLADDVSFEDKGAKAVLTFVTLK